MIARPGQRCQAVLANLASRSPELVVPRSSSAGLFLRTTRRKTPEPEVSMNAPVSEVSIAHVTVEVRKPDRLRSWLAALAGDGPRVTFDDVPRRGALRVTGGTKDDLAVLGLSFPDEPAFEAALRRLHDRGIAWQETTPQQGWSRAVRTEDPAGTALELLVRDRSWVDEPRGWPLGHVALTHPKVSELETFYAETIGFRCNERLASRVGPLSLQGSFLGSARHHHTVAILNVPSFRRLHHVFFGAPDVGVVAERWFLARAAGIHLSLDLGRHARPDGTTSFYAASPCGFDVEIGSGGNLLEESFVPQSSTSPLASAWGHASSFRSRLRVAVALLAQGLGMAA
jgi:catechol 2,3-dioxygenase-like lactoylglutathione lyase family enzyme